MKNIKTTPYDLEYFLLSNVDSLVRGLSELDISYLPNNRLATQLYHTLGQHCTQREVEARAERLKIEAEEKAARRATTD